MLGGGLFTRPTAAIHCGVAYGLRHAGRIVVRIAAPLRDPHRLGPAVGTHQLLQNGKRLLEALGRARRVVHVQVEHVHPPQAALRHEIVRQPSGEVRADAPHDAALRVSGVQGAAPGLA